MGSKKGRCFDAGCGEGFFLDYFEKEQWEVCGCDYSSFGMKTHNPNLLPYLFEGNIYTIIDEMKNKSKTFDLVNLTNVLEHVPDPKILLNLIKEILSENSLLRIVVPNDFSLFQKLLISRNKLKAETWFIPPDHINYFTQDTLVNFVTKNGFNVVKMLGDFPIEFFLYNKHSNYWEDRSKGKDAHFARIEIENFLIKQNPKAYMQYMEAGINVGIGRDITIFLKLK